MPAWEAEDRAAGLACAFSMETALCAPPPTESTVYDVVLNGINARRALVVADSAYPRR